MAKVRVVWEGLDDVKTLLRTLPDEMATESGKQAESAANSAALDIRSAYPVHTGNLRKGVKVEVVNRGRYKTGRRVRSGAPHAWLFEVGSAVRHTKSGANRGVMPPGHVFVPRVIKWRRRFVEAMKVALLRHGASKVTGD